MLSTLQPANEDLYVGTVALMPELAKARWMKKLQAQQLKKQGEVHDKLKKEYLVEILPDEE